MASLKLGVVVVDLRGTVGGLTFSKNKAGNYAKLWARGANPRTEGQSEERAFVGRMPEEWRALSGAQRTAWDTFAALGAQELTNSMGETYYASGYNWFVKCNVRLLRVERSTIAAVPAQARPSAPTIDDFRVCVAGSDPDLCTGGTASASTEQGVHVAARAFDDDLDLFWSSVSGTPTGWIRYDLATAKNIKRYRVRSRSSLADAAPRDWTFEVYTGGAWEVLQSVTDVTMAVSTWYEFFCENAYTETDYRLNISDNNGNALYVQVAEIEMMAGDVGQSVVVYPEDEFDDSPDWDLVLHIGMGNSTGQAVKYAGFGEVVAKQLPGRAHEVVQSEIEDRFGTVLENRSWFARLARQTTEGIRSAWATMRTETSS